jgi:hypothetical protein
MDGLEIIMLSEISQVQKSKYCMFFKQFEKGRKRRNYNIKEG